ncbi:MAG: hypothetical protein LZ163_02080 [Thaumarchaeota archaeon]|jgi:hypothetical protein|nr:hypothetical protein [Candidatus Terraquivivens yellowstonensis]
MSTISPDELINEVQPWNVDSWKNFVKNYVVPIKCLAETVAKQFVGDASSEASKFLADSAVRVIGAAKSFLGEVMAEFEVPADPIECLRLLVERSGNAFLGVNEAGKYTLLAWTLRKVTKEYLLEALYPTLKDEEKRKKTFELLGIREDLPLFVPAVKSALTENLTILGYPDYPSICRVEEWGHYVTLSILPAKEFTFGGAICRFVDGLVAVLSRPGILSGVEPSTDVVKTYLEKAPLRPVELQYGWNYLNWKTSYTSLAELSRWRADCAWVISGFAVRCVDHLESPDKWSPSFVRQETNLLSFFRWLMPSLIIGRTEMLLSADGRVALLLERTL